MTIPLASTVSEHSAAILLWSGVLLLAIIVLSLGVWYYRRRWISSDDSSNVAPWTLDDIRRLHEEGTLTAAEYQALRENMLGAYRIAPPGMRKTTSPAESGGSGAQDADFDLEKRPPA